MMMTPSSFSLCLIFCNEHPCIACTMTTELRTIYEYCSTTDDLLSMYFMSLSSRRLKKQDVKRNTVDRLHFGVNGSFPCVVQIPG